MVHLENELMSTPHIDISSLNLTEYFKQHNQNIMYASPSPVVQQASESSFYTPFLNWANADPLNWILVGTGGVLLGQIYQNYKEKASRIGWLPAFSMTALSFWGIMKYNKWIGGAFVVLSLGMLIQACIYNDECEEEETQVEIKEEKPIPIKIQPRAIPQPKIGIMDSYNPYTMSISSGFRIF